jgi:hypothetical protein
MPAPGGELIMETIIRMPEVRLDAAERTNPWGCEEGVEKPQSRYVIVAIVSERAIGRGA